MHYEVPEKLREIASIFKDNGFSLYLVGGAVRDYILGFANHDYDFTTDANPYEIKKMFKRTIDTGIKHGTVTVLYKGESYEITTFRADGEYHDGRHPDSVEFIRNIDEDLKRRDFTINALAVNLDNGNIIDNHNGLADLEKRKIRAIGVAEERFLEDGLRLMRACRFASKLDFDIEESTKNAMAKLYKNIENVSKERVKEELFRLIDGKAPRRGLEAMRETKIMDIVLPELSRCYGVMQGGYHSEDVYTHSVLALEYATAHNYEINLKVAALFHDLGKPDALKEGQERNTFYSHDIKGEAIAKEILDRLKASNAEKYEISHLVREHMFAYSPDWSDGAVRRFINRVGREYIDKLFLLRDADRAATLGPMPDGSALDRELKERVEKLLETKQALSLKDLAIRGEDLMAIGIKGPMLGKTLNYLLSLVIEDPEKNQRETLLSLSECYAQCQEK